MPERQTTIGFLGLGAIGTPMAERLVRGGANVVVYNRTAAKAAAFRDRAQIAATPAEVADQADIVFACVTGAEAYRDIVLGPTGIIHGSRAKDYVHVGTSQVELVKDLAQALAARGIASLDAPVTGGVPRAVNGTLTVMAAGPRAVFERSGPYLKHYASKVIYLGDRVGAAQVMKYVNNVLSASNLALACEAMVVGRKAGLDSRAMLEVINNGTGQNSATLTKIPDQVLTRKFNHGGGLGLMLKDLEVFGEVAARQGVSGPLAQAVIESFRTAAREEGETEDLTKIIRPMERAAEVIVET
jgi:3-hydroxyisobutyrate dehydrogenase-like beta-hydroxyacid dehydrogenase